MTLTAAGAGPNVYGMDTATITHTDGRQATAPAAFAAKWNQQVIDSLVMQAHRGGVADRATCRACGVTAL